MQGGTHKRLLIWRFTHACLLRSEYCRVMAKLTTLSQTHKFLHLPVASFLQLNGSCKYVSSNRGSVTPMCQIMHSFVRLVTLGQGTVKYRDTTKLMLQSVQGVKTVEQAAARLARALRILSYPVGTNELLRLSAFLQNSNITTLGMHKA